MGTSSPTQGWRPASFKREIEVTWKGRKSCSSETPRLWTTRWRGWRSEAWPGTSRTDTVANILASSPVRNEQKKWESKFKETSPGSHGLVVRVGVGAAREPRIKFSYFQLLIPFSSDIRTFGWVKNWSGHDKLVDLAFPCSYKRGVDKRAYLRAT